MLPDVTAVTTFKIVAVWRRRAGRVRLPRTPATESDRKSADFLLGKRCRTTTERTFVGQREDQSLLTQCADSTAKPDKRTASPC